MLRVGLVAVAASVLACGGSARVHRAGEPYLREIRIEGNHAIDSDTLIDGLLMHRRQQAGQPIDEYQLTVDASRITGAYDKLGYFSVELRSRVDHAGDAEIVVFTVVEGRRATAHVEVRGLPADLPIADARALIRLAEGGPFDYAAYDVAKAPLLRLVEDAGYAHARLDAGVVADRVQARATARYTFDAGPRCTFGAVSIAGTDGALADAVRARLAVVAGERYSTTAIAATQRALYGMGRFSTVRVDIDRDPTTTVIPVRVAVTEASRHEFRIGGGFGIDPVNYSVRGRAQYTQVGWPFPLSTVGVDFKPAYTLLRTSCPWYRPWTCQREPRVRLIGTLTQQDFVFTNVRGEVEGGLDFLTIEAYTIEGIHARLGLATPIGTPRVQLRIGWLLGEYYFRGVNAALDPATAHRIGIDRDERLGTYTQALTLDLRDHPIEPKYGGYAELRVAEGTRYAGGAYQFVEATPELRGFAPIGSSVLAARARVGRIFGDVPPTERYYAGGASSDRGFPERQLSPITTSMGNSVVYGGAALVETGAELRVPLGTPKGLALGGVAFVDGGDVEDNAASLDLTRLHWAVGFGLRWFLLPVGPARLDFAYRLGHDDPNQPKLSRFQWFLSVGEAY